VHWPLGPELSLHILPLDSVTVRQREERNERARKRQINQQEREHKQSLTTLKETMADNNDDKRVKKEDNQSLIDRFDNLLHKHEELLEERDLMSKRLADQQTYIHSLTQSRQVISTATMNKTLTINPTEGLVFVEHTAKTLLSKRIGHLLETEPITCATNQDVTDWIDTFEDKCDRLLLNDEQKFSIVVDLLKDSAKMWFDTHKAVILDWSSFKAKIIAHFELIMGVDSFERYKQLYNRRRFHNESAIDYFHNMIKLCRKANDSMDEATQIKHLLEGLSLREKSYIDVRKPETIERFLQILIESDKVILEEMARQPTTNQSDRRFTQGKARVSTPTSAINTNTDRPAFRHPNYSNPSQNNAYQVPQEANRSRTIGCWLCGANDHYRSNCPKNY
jgi:hypothetical protein